MQLLPQHLHSTNCQECSSWNRQENRLHEVTEWVNGPTKGYCSRVKSSLPNDQSHSYFFLYSSMSVLNSHRKSVCPFVKSYGHCSTKKPSNRILYPNGNPLKNGVKIHGQSEKIGILMILRFFCRFLLNFRFFLLFFMQRLSFRMRLTRIGLILLLQ